VTTGTRRAPKRRFISIDPISGVLPVTWEADDADQWADKDQVIRLAEIVLALVDLRVEGLRLPQITALGGLSVHAWPHQPETIAGGYFAELLATAQAGEFLPEVSQAVSEVRSRYARAGQRFGEVHS
jgi:hypothetical protein